MKLWKALQEWRHRQQQKIGKKTKRKRKCVGMGEIYWPEKLHGFADFTIFPPHHKHFKWTVCGWVRTNFYYVEPMK